MEQQGKRGRIHEPHNEYLHPLYKLPPNPRTSKRAEDLSDKMARGVKTRRSGKLSRARFGGTPAPATVAAAVKKATMNMAKKNAGFVDQAAAAYDMNLTGSVTHIAIVPQGASVNQRIGKRITWKGMQIRGFVQAKAATTIAKGTILIIYDRDPSGSPPALPAVGDILASASANAFLNDANSDRFRVLRRIDVSVTGNSATPATGREGQVIEEYVDLKGLKSVFKAVASGAIGDISDGALYLCVVGNIAAGTTDITATLSFRTRFIDVPG